MKKTLVTLVLMFCTGVATSNDVYKSDIDIDLTNKTALQDGLHTFANYCIGCHSARFQRWERTATDLGIPEDIMVENIIPNGQKIGDHMLSSMKDADAKRFFGVKPPDLTMVTRVRGEAWVYNYLKSFYVDKTRTFGYNNLVFDKVAMPNVLAYLQGAQTTGCKYVPVVNGELDLLTGLPVTEFACNQLVIKNGTGTLTEYEFNNKIKNLVAFLSYVAEPNKLQSHAMGWKVLVYLLIFTTFAYFLKKEYWRDVKHNS